MTKIDIDEARQAICDLPAGTSHGETPAPEHVYLPRSHLRAMDPNTLLVTGMRGAGKTFWWSALQEGVVRQLVGAQRSTLGENTEVRTGFGVRPVLAEYPNKDVLHNLIDDGFQPRAIWRTVHAWQLAPNDHPIKQCHSWPSRTRYVSTNAEATEHLFQERDAELDRKGVYLLILCDALDRCADDWKEMYRTIRGLLQTAIELRSYRRLRVKVFLRSDQIDESRIGDFPDASKILSSAVELNWPRHELYGLLWHCLANGRLGTAFRTFFQAGDWPSMTVAGRQIFSVPRSSIFREEYQRKKFHAIAGRWMGTDRRRGFPYTWIPSHLADTDGRVSPRSFMAALRTAADDTTDRHSEHEHALHYDSIKRGVQAASEIRVSELQEDYPWVHRVLSPLRGMVVPCEFDEIAERWRSRGVLERLAEETEQNEVKLPPLHIDRGAEGVREDLESLRVFMHMRDGRVNIPDVFRVGYGLGRRGGVRPVQ